MTEEQAPKKSKDPELVAIGERIKAVREERDLTQGQLGVKLGMSSVAVSQYESGERQMPITRLKKIARALHCSTAYLLGEWDLEREKTIEIAGALEGKPPYVQAAARQAMEAVLNAAEAAGDISDGRTLGRRAE